MPLTVPAFAFGETVKVFEAVSGLPLQALTVYTMFVVPAATAVTTPVDEFTVATDVLELLQLPPEVPLLVYVAVCPIQSGEVPLTVPGNGSVLTVKVFDAVSGLPLQALIV